MTELTEPPELAKRMLNTRPALFLGAGACISSGGPTGSQLANRLKDAFRLERDLRDDLREVASVVERRFSRRELVAAIVNDLKPLEPDGALLALARVDWRAIFTTNYDQLVEQAYKRVGKDLSIVRSNFDYTVDYDPRATPLFKVHGCITQDTSHGHRAPMVLTYRDYDSATKFRETLFERLQVELATGPLLFIGHSIQDQDVEFILTEAIRCIQRSGGQGEVFAVFKDIDEERAGIWIDRGLRGVCCASINEIANEFAALSETIPTLTAKGGKESSLPAALEPSTILVMAQHQQANPRGMFYGAPATYEDIRRGYTFPRDAEGRLSATNKPIICVLGAAGTGKSTLARRLLFEHFSNTTTVYEHRSEIPFASSHWIKYETELRKVNESAFLLIDSCTQFQSQVNRLVENLPTDNSSLRLLLTAETSVWRLRQKHARLFSDSETLILSALSTRELHGLLNIVTNTRELRQHAETSFLRQDRQSQSRQLSRRCSADMFVCLKALFSSESLDDIILSEFSALEHPYQDVYRLTCALEAASSSPHRQMILRLSGLSLNLIAASLEVLEGLVFESDRSASPGIFLWKSRHEVIAKIISTYKFGNPDDLYSLLKQAIESANPTFHEEVKMLREMCNSERGVRGIPDGIRRIDLYQLIADVLPSDNVVRHRLIYELIRNRRLGDAEAELERAIEDVRLDPPLQRYKAKLLLERAKNPALESVDRRAIIDSAITEAQNGIERFPNSKYLYFILADAAEDWHYETGEHGRLEWAKYELQRAFERLLDPDLLERVRRMPN